MIIYRRCVGCGFVTRHPVRWCNHCGGRFVKVHGSYVEYERAGKRWYDVFHESRSQKKEAT